MKAKATKPAPTNNRPARTYLLSFQKEHCYQGTRYHWMICEAQNLDELVSWGYAPTQEEAEAAARKEVTDLSSGLTHGGQVTSTRKALVRR